MAEESSTTSRSAYWREYSRKRYKERPEISLQAAIRYYRKKKAQGLEWEPKSCTKLYIWCQQNNLDAKEVVEGTQQLPTK